MDAEAEHGESLVGLYETPDEGDFSQEQDGRGLPPGWEDTLYEEHRDRQNEELECAKAEAPASPLMKRRHTGQGSRPGRRWDCWTLSSENIEGLANRLGHDPAQLSDDDIQEIASRFQSGLLWALADWEAILGEAITQVKGEAP